MEEHLYPTIIRSFLKQKKNSDDNVREKEMYEIDILHSFETHGSYNLEHVSSVFDFLATMQHYGLPTRMLDWTRNPYAAILFAVFLKKENSESEKTFDKVKLDFKNYYYVLRIDITEHVRLFDIVSCCDEKYNSKYIAQDIPYTIKYLHMLKTVDRLLCKNTNENEIRKIIKNIYLNTNSEYLFNSLRKDNISKNKCLRMNGYIRKNVKKLKKDKNTILFVEPRYSNRRMAAQYGLFQVPNELDKEKISKTILANADILAINKDLRLEIITELAAEGQDYYGLMPDLQGICTYAKADTDNWLSNKNNL